MPQTTELRRQNADQHKCGLLNFHPHWLQRYANTKTFMMVYGLLGTIQAMSYMYFVVTLTTIEKRYKIPSQTTGIILSGNEISQILLSLILSYIGGQRNRPRWIAWGIVFCGLSCYILALPHFIYGAGEDALQLTKEFYNETEHVGNLTSTLLVDSARLQGNSQQLCGIEKPISECESLLSVIPLILIFLSQFVLGIGNTLYYSLGQTYLDDNTKKSNTPLILAMAMALRMIGPVFGFFLGFVSLNMYIDPRKTPLIDNKDPRWLGAWWFGWIILGTLMVLFSGLIGLFPKQLPKKKSTAYNSHIPEVLKHEQFQLDEGVPLGRGFASNATLDAPPPASDLPQIKDFPKALMRLLRNKLLIFNNIAAVFYILGAAGYITFLTKYMEVQFHKSAQSATIIVGPLSIIGMVIGLLGSGLIISKKKPRPSKVLMWNVLIGFVSIIGQFSYMFMYCNDSVSLVSDGKLNLSSSCNSNCACDSVPYSPICHEPSDTTYFSPCHAGCQSWDPKEKVYSNCSCLHVDVPITSIPITTTPSTTKMNVLKKLLKSSTTEGPITQILTTISAQMNAETLIRTSTSAPVRTTRIANDDNDVDDIGTLTTTEMFSARLRRSIDDQSDILKPGICVKGCNTAFWSFSIAAMIINWFGSSGRIGNLLVSYRAVATEEKSFAQGLTLMMISLFALIPGPIIFGRIIDSTCLVWTKTCSGNGNCQLYDQASFRYMVNVVAMVLTFIGVFFDFLVWYYGRELDLYGNIELERLEQLKKKNKAITPLMGRQ